MTPQLYQMAASAVLVVHLGFIVFVAVGGYACWRWPRFLWVHLPAVAWSVPMQILGWTCPLTPLENLLLALAGGEGYGGGFIEHYVASWVYPDWRGPGMGVAIGALAAAVNGPAYWGCYRRWRGASSEAASTPG